MPHLPPMNIEDLQMRLRRFAIERNWQPFQTPKNLAMAMVVEAAELVEIFQWLTPEQSQQIQADPAQHQHLGEEIADVMLYLLQIADHTGIDINAAVERKLLLNAIKHPVATRQ
jgi:NTP pyrophosphatase (non-canonical NTP hydrolase)